VVRLWSATSVDRRRRVHSPWDQRLRRRDAAHSSRRDGDRGAAAPDGAAMERSLSSDAVSV